MLAVAASPLQRKTAFSGVCLFGVGLFTGIWSAAALTGAVKIGIPRLALIAHLNALLGGLWLVAVASTMPHLNYDHRQLKRLNLFTTIPAWANWLVTLVASFLGVNGLTYTTDNANNTIAFLLQALVVVPSLLAAVYWVRGFLTQARA